MLRKMWEHGNNRAADDQPLNPQLYQAVTEITGMEPRIKDPGVRRVVGRNGEPQWGEQYQANCPLCGDNRGRFLISYAFGTPDPRNLRPILNAWHCFNEKCHQSEINQYRLYQLLRQAGYRSRQVNRAVGRLQPQPADRPILIMPPDGLAPINRLPRSHSAVDYLVARGFDVDELWARWGVAFCADGVNLQPVVSNRIFIPIYGVADSSQYKSDAAVQLKLLGWQARVIGEAAGRGPKYLTMKGFEKSKTLYGLPNALVGNGPVVICEGVADCWKVGSGAVAILGKSLSRRQVELIVEYFSGRPIVVLLDSDAREEAAAIVRQLSSHGRGRAGDYCVVAATLPHGRHDPGDCSREEIRHAVAAALGLSPEELQIKSAFQVLGREAVLAGLRQPQCEEPSAITYAIRPQSANDAPCQTLDGIALVNAAGSAAYLANWHRKALALYGGVPRVYENALESRRLEQKAGLPLASEFHCLRTMGRLLNENKPSDLKSMLSRYAGGLPEELRHSLSHNPTVSTALLEAVQLQHVFRNGELADEIKRRGLEFVYREVELPVIDVANSMMEAGIRIDTGRLAELREKHPQSAGTCQAILRSADPLTGLVHSAIDPLGTVTGRFSCNSPNLQGLPKKLRSIFVANSGCQLIEADLSQFELRVLAHFSQDPALVKAFKGDVDVHRLTAAAILGKPEWQLSAKERAVGKVVNFAIIYGITPKGLVQQLDVTDNEAAALIDRYMHKYNGVAAWIASVERQVCQTGFVTTLFGRRRRLPEAKSFDRTKASRAKRQAVNFVLQGTAADLHKLSLIALHRSLPEGCRLLLTMHDAVLVEAPDWLVEEAVEQIRRAVTATPKNFSIPLKVESGIGGNWAECKVATQPAYA